MKNNVTVVILAAGLGTRMKSKKAKVLHEAGGDTLLNHVLRAAMYVAEAEQIFVVVGHQAEQVKASVTIPGVRFAEQREQRGTGHALLCARDAGAAGGENLLILNGDGPLLRPQTLSGLLDLRKSRNEGGCVVTAELTDPTGYGRVKRTESGHIRAVVEQKSATPAELKIREINTGVYLFDAPAFWAHIGKMTPNNAANEFYLTDMIEILSRNQYPIAPFLVTDETELLGINTRAELAVADRILRSRKNNELLLSGVTIENPESVLVDVNVTVGMDTLIGANAQLRGQTKVGGNCRIGAGSILRNCVIEDEVEILPYVVAQDTRIGKGAFVGPFARLRQKADVGPDVHIGNFVELKNTSMAAGSKANHLAYLGDTTIGKGTNVGAGTITCNYDGLNKHRTEIEEGVFVGSNSTLVAPVRLGSGAYIAAGSVITNDVEADALAIGRGRQENKPDWAKRRRAATPEHKKKS
jgi:bifunctional UDP-N-acetylglucosamine pyrophosphorylase / glucosamine-1-phosphate N-acetyltransferase